MTYLTSSTVLQFVKWSTEMRRDILFYDYSKSSPLRIQSSTPWLLSITLWHLRIPASYNIQFHDLTARSEVFRLFTTYTSTYMIIRYYKERFFTFSKYLMNSLILSVCDIFMLFLLFTALSFTSFLFGKVSITICNTVVVKNFHLFIVVVVIWNFSWFLWTVHFRKWNDFGVYYFKDFKKREKS